MGVSAIDILEAGLLANGKLPDIYWELDLSGSEIKILRYVYNNCIRLYKTVKIFPKGSDGSPRFWRGKERMADDCKLSYPTFRNGVRHLAELGLVTSMDGEEDEEQLYCIGLSAKFVNSVVLGSTENNFRSPLLRDLKGLIYLIYDNLTNLMINKQVNLSKLPLFSLRENKPSEALGLCSVTGNENLIYVESTLEGQETPDSENLTGKSSSEQEDNKIVYKSIKVNREPIFLVPEKARIHSAQQKLKMLQHVRTPLETRVLKVVEYYEYKCRQAIHSSGFRALGKNFRNHKNWKFFVRLYQLCEENSWDYKVYIDAQFDRVKYWSRKQAYPYANQFTSEGAINYYYGYVKDYKEKNSITSDIKVKSHKVKSVKQQIIDEVISDCDSISEYIAKAGKRKSNQGLSPEQLKILYLSDHWIGLSVHYLASIPWFLSYLEQFPEETFIAELKQEIQQLRKPGKMFNLITEIVGKTEQQMGIPKTLNL